MENYRIQGLAEGTSEVRHVVAPGTEKFIILEKVREGENGSVRTGFKFCLGAPLSSEEIIAEKMLKEEAEGRLVPERLVFKGK